MLHIDVYTQAGEKKGEKKLSEVLFGAKVNTGLMHQALIREQANARQNLAYTKTRAEVRGGGRKPFRQKGTGRARQGSIRAPHMRGGGVTFGPTGSESYFVRMPRKQRRLALFSALTVKLQEKAVFALEGYAGDISTKKFAELVKKLPVERNVLFLLPEHNEVLEKSSRNVASVKTLLASYININDLLKYRKICLVSDADKTLETTFLK